MPLVSALAVVCKVETVWKAWKSSGNLKGLFWVWRNCGTP